MKPSLHLLALAVLALSACDDGVTSTSGRALCDGNLDPREETVDDLFDGDGDGFVDGSNPECRANYDASELDCNDNDAAISPAADEATCNDIDDDCDPDTLDAPDLDDDGYSICDADCDDSNPDMAPGFAEVACDEIDNDCDPSTSDSSDLDDDGYTSCEDCVDSNPNVNPGQDEVTCDGADNDCDPTTVDGVDADLDGSTDCFDCDDQNPNVYPGLAEICDDGIDQNCDGSDLPCAAETFSGNWSTNATAYSCGGGNVDVNFSTVTIQDQDPNITFVFVGSAHPGALMGTLSSTDTFTASASYPGACSKTFSLSGSFTGQNAFSATLTGTFTGCNGCTNQTWTLTGTR